MLGDPRPCSAILPAAGTSMRPEADQRRAIWPSYRQHLIRPEKLRAASVNRKVQALKQFFGWAQRMKQMPANPAALQFLRRKERSQAESRPAEVTAAAIGAKEG